MIIELKKLEKFLFLVKNKEIKEIYIKTDKFSVIVNKEKINTNKHLSIDVQKNNNLKVKNKETSNFIRQNNRNIDTNTSKKIVNDNNELIIEASKNYSTIVSPMVGTFYQSSGPNEAPFIEVNDIVKKQQVVCIIEAMKLMNEIESEVNGKIIEILVKDGNIVDCGQALMKVQPIN
uniref:Biotin carboxyl carrier protein of acetyl-CoA carboxylase n=1 Tax=Platysiphonia delicata TaxID=2006979 RepID=A0A1Z1M0J3_9FLOR|nr:acetyl-CoA carboxylase biotin carboxyl carrier protein [Platysiphonia delicata]ARW59617.1 acetyl-CoA carboxylase biotin carboxyl carrier protein [Platysiphonia delicata]